MEILTNDPQFFTASIYRWVPVLRTDFYKQVILKSLDFLVMDKRVFVHAFVIMDNHIHLIWQMREGHLPQNVQRDFLKFTAQQIRLELMNENSGLLPLLEVNLKDRKYQIWQRNSLGISLYSPAVFDQKLQYIHQNPVKAGLCSYPEEYVFSSARFYELNEETHRFLTHYKE